MKVNWRLGLSEGLFEALGKGARERAENCPEAERQEEGQESRGAQAQGFASCSGRLPLHSAPGRALARARFGPWQTVCHRFRHWARLGVWQKVLEGLARGARGKLRLVDATFCKGHQFANIGADRRPQQAIGKSKGGWNTRINALTDCRGHALKPVLTAGNRHDLKAVDKLAEGWRHAVPVADRACDCDRLRATLGAPRARSCIPPRKGRKQPASWHRGW